MEDSICIDSDFLIDFLRDKPEAVNWIIEHEDDYTLATTTINIFELYAGAYKSKDSKNKIEAIKKLIERLRILNLSLKSAEVAGKEDANLKNQGSSIEFRDLFIGIIALSEGFVIKTNNKKHFSRIRGLTVLD